MNRITFAPLLVVLLFVSSCNKTSIHLYSSTNENIRYEGRTRVISENEVQLIGSASSASFAFTGDTCVIHLRNNTPNKMYNYVSFELNCEYIQRMMIHGDTTLSIPIPVTSDSKVHHLTVYKSTESANGFVIIEGITCEKLVKLPALPVHKIEFIGNSITCGMGVDLSQIPCNANQWYDQHNAYYAYGPVVSRMLNTQYMLSSVSGIGIYRNWDVDGPTMPQVYENLYLNTDTTYRWDFHRFTPNIVSICLGTNDFSDGDGIHSRLPFDAEKFTETYIEFVEKIIIHYPNAQIALLASPMLNGEKDILLHESLQQVKAHCDILSQKPIALFSFEGIMPHGCDYHPDKNDQQQMAEQLYPFYKELLNR